MKSKAIDRIKKQTLNDSFEDLSIGCLNERLEQNYCWNEVFLGGE